MLSIENGTRSLVQSFGSIEDFLQQRFSPRARKWFSNSSGAKPSSFSGDLEQAFSLVVGDLLDVAVVLKQEQQRVVVDR